MEETAELKLEKADAELQAEGMNVLFLWLRTRIMYLFEFHSYRWAAQTTPSCYTAMPGRQDSTRERYNAYATPDDPERGQEAKEYSQQGIWAS